jgi:hypothetical protein
MTRRFTGIGTRDRHWRLMNVGHAFLESAVTLSEALPKVEERRHGGICLLAPITRDLYEGLEHFLQGASSALGLKPAPGSTPTRLWTAYQKALRQEPADSGLRFDRACVRRVYLWNHWVATAVRSGRAAGEDQNRNWQTQYRGQAINEKELHDLAVRCRDESARVHILLIQRANREYKLELGLPWWEPEHLVQDHVQEMLRHLEQHPHPSESTGTKKRN